jgi:O-antigen ligase
VLKYIEYFIVFFMMVNHVENERQIKRFIFFLFLTCFIVSIIGILQIPEGGRVSAPFEGEEGEPNTFGGYLVLTLSVVIGVIACIKDKRIKYLLIGMLVFVIPPLLFTQSRSSYLALLFSALTLAWFSKRRLIYIAGMVFLIIISPFILPQAVKQRIMYTFTQRYHIEQVQVGDIRIDTSTSARLISWKEALVDWTKRPILGYGVTGYRFIDAQFPRVLTETGIIGFFAFLYLLSAVCMMTYRNMVVLKNPFHKGIAYGFLAGFVGLLFHAIGANTFIIVRIMEPFWFYAGIVAVLPELENKKLEPLMQAA